MALPPGEQATASGVPVVALQQFLAALRARDFVGAKRLAFQSESLHLEPCPAVREVLGCFCVRLRFRLGLGHVLRYEPSVTAPAGVFADISSSSCSRASRIILIALNQRR